MKKNVVIEGEDSRRWNAIITDILRWYKAFCQQHHLRWIIAYGSAIGAARHKGLIPWDDDIDVVMPRPDYERFVALCKTEDLGPYEFISFETTPHYCLPFAKISDRRTTLIESADYRYKAGLYIDIFVIDGASPDPDERRRLIHAYTKAWHRFAMASSYYSWGTCLRLLREHHPDRLLHYWLLSLRRKHNCKKYYERMESIARRYSYEDSDTLIGYPPIYGEREIMPKAWMEDLIELPFEDLTVPIPRDYAAFLNHFYGDYTQLPPESERNSHHLKYYVNFGSRDF